MTFNKYGIEYKGITYPCCCQMSKDIIQAVLQFDPTEWEVKELCSRKNCIERNEPINYNELVTYIEQKKRFANRLKKDIANYYLNIIKDRLLKRGEQYTELDFDDEYINNELQTSAPDNNTQKNSGLNAKLYAHLYLMECQAEQNEDWRHYTQMKLEETFSKLSNGVRNGNTIRKEFDKIKNKGESEIFNYEYLEETLKPGWRDNILKIAKNKDALLKLFDANGI